MTETTIHATVRGEAKSWSYGDLPTAMKVWERLATSRTVPGTSDAVTDLVLRSGDHETKLGQPYEGLSVP